MKDLKQELEKLSTTVNSLKETIDHNFGMLNIAIGNIIEKANEKSEEQKPTVRVIPFDIEKAKQGAKIMTRDGHDARILCYDRNSEDYPIVVLVLRSNEDEYEEEIVSYTNDGKYYPDDESGYDLFIKEECV